MTPLPDPGGTKTAQEKAIKAAKPVVRRCGMGNRWLATSPPDLDFPRIGVFGKDDRAATANWRRSALRWLEILYMPGAHRG